MKKQIPLIFLLILSGCFGNRPAKLVAEYHRSVVDFYEGRRPNIEHYSMDLKTALEDLTRSGKINFKVITMENVIYSKDNYALVKKTAETFYREAIDINFNADYGSPLVVRIYYYPEHEEAIERFISRLKELG